MSRSTTLTITDTRQIASKMGADLRNMNTRTGYPALDQIPLFVEEVAQYLKAGYLKEVKFGFRNGDVWKYYLRYQALAGGHLTDGAPGGLPNMDVSNLTFYSYLITNSTYSSLAQADRDSFERDLPVQRAGAAEPSSYGGITTGGHSYARNGVGLGREIYRTH
ncbi:hypothetical protein [Nocardioides sp. WS12]|uniref:HORMA-1 domain-containing protein n=1 Tax=Nocardioides sp. WS12 TaxID=2486272 RepID=UPI0015FCA20E|nr:hypothetical protein [Nocardioides sp. WS12]